MDTSSCSHDAVSGSPGAAFARPSRRTLPASLGLASLGLASLGLAVTLASSTALAQDALPEPLPSDGSVVNAYTRPALPPGEAVHLELVPALHANGVGDVSLEGPDGFEWTCHLPCSLDAPRGHHRLFGPNLDVQFDLDLAYARLAVSGATPPPVLESIGGLVAGSALMVAGIYTIANTAKADEIVGGSVLTGLGGVLIGAVVVLLVDALANAGGDVELVASSDRLVALRDGLLLRFE